MNDLPKTAAARDGARALPIFLDELARERGWSKRKLEYVCKGGRLVYWQDTPRGRRYTTREEVENFDRRGLKASPGSLARSNEGRIERLEEAVGQMNREIREIRGMVFAEGKEAAA